MFKSHYDSPWRRMMYHLISQSKEMQVDSGWEEREREFKKHQLLSPCSCKRKCIENICEERRKDINQQFWELDYGQRWMWIKSKERVESTKRPRKDLTGDVQRNFSRHYFLNDQEEWTYSLLDLFSANIRLHFRQSNHSNSQKLQGRSYDI